MKRTHSRIIMGATISAAAIAVVVDHTRQRLPEPQKLASQEAVIIIEEGEEMPTPSDECGTSARPGRRPSPCSL
jgi:hypothetical protein